VTTAGPETCSALARARRRAEAPRAGASVVRAVLACLVMLGVAGCQPSHEALLLGRAATGEVVAVRPLSLCATPVWSVDFHALTDDSGTASFVWRIESNDPQGALLPDVVVLGDVPTGYRETRPAAMQPLLEASQWRITINQDASFNVTAPEAAGDVIDSQGESGPIETVVREQRCTP
jgi:hypothetical protein